MAWDFGVFPAETLRWRLAGAQLSGPGTLSGPPQTAEISGGGWWTCEPAGMLLWTQDEWSAYEGLLLDLFGGVETIEVPMAANLVGSADVVATVTAAAALRATTMELTATAGTIRPGAPFGITHATKGKRGYMVRKIVSEVAGVYTVKILPPLREAVADDAAVDFATPAVLMKMDDPGGDAWPTIGPDLSARTSIRFVEAFPDGV